MRDALNYYIEQAVNFDGLALQSQVNNMLRHDDFLQFSERILTVKRRRTYHPSYRNVDNVLGYF